MANKDSKKEAKKKPLLSAKEKKVAKQAKKKKAQLDWGSMTKAPVCH